MGEVVAAHAVIVLEMPDHGFDRSPTFELAFDLLSDPAPLSGNVDLELMFGRGVVATIAGIGNDALEHVTDQRLHIGNDFGERVPVVRVARQCRHMGDELAAGRMLYGSGDADLDADLWTTPALQVGFDRRVGAVCANLSGFDLGFSPRAIMDIRAFLSSITRRPRPAMESNQVLRNADGTVRPFVFSVSQTSAGC